MVAHEKSIWFRCMLAASLFVLVLAGCGDVSESGSSQIAQHSKKGQPTETGESHAAERSADCKPTQPDMLGPFYEPGAPVRTSVGSGYVLSGTVLAAEEECKPIPNARIEFWLANPRGEYDDAHRATVLAGQRGEYRLESNVPVSYGGRPPHIHVRVRAPGYEELVTQHYPERGQRKATFDLVLVGE
jgi:protocatechuate 3,4-dioxygenase beta subunit